jgi:tRNA nucleotidyltransferase (CCA-adding enzyme)
VRRTKAVSGAHPEVVDVIVGGSYAKNTWLPGHADIDIFVRFSPDTDIATFERVGLEIGDSATRGHPRGKKYSQHPYTEAEVDGVKVNIVPCFHVKAGEWKSAADRSPFHVQLITTKFGDEQRLQVRLLKKFMRAVRVYGAEIETEGFSGYAAEVLILQEGSFEATLRSFAQLKVPPGETLLSLADPVDEGRDLARAISAEKVGRFVLASRAFLKEPSIGYFDHMRRSPRAALANRVVAVVFDHPELSEDVLWGELKRTYRHLRTHVEGEGFRILRGAVASDGRRSSAFIFLPEQDGLPELQERSGPRVDMERESIKFVSKNSARATLIWVGEDAKLRILQNRRERNLVPLLQAYIRREVESIGASRDLMAPLKRAKVLSHPALSGLARRRPWLSEGIAEIVSDSFGARAS